MYTQVLLLLCGVCILLIDKSSTLDRPMCDENIGEFYSQSDNKCLPCDTCENGFGRDTETIIPRDEDGQPLDCYRCTECLKGSHSMNGECIRCRQCSQLHRHVKEPCTSLQNTICGNCFQKSYDYYQIEEGFADTTKPCRHCVFDRVGVPECDHTHPHRPNPPKSPTEMAIGIAVAVLIAGSVVVGVVVCRYCRGGRTGGNQIVISESLDSEQLDNIIKDTEPLLRSAVNPPVGLPVVTDEDERTLPGDSAMHDVTSPGHIVIDSELERTGMEPEELRCGGSDLEVDGLFLSNELPYTSVKSDNTILKSLVPVTSASLDDIGLVDVVASMPSSDQETDRQGSDLPTGTPATSCNLLAQAELVISLGLLIAVSKNLSIKEIGKLLRQLKLTNADTKLDNLKAQFDGQEVVYQGLLTWKQEFGNFATLIKMSDALKNIGRRDIADRLLTF